MTPENDRFPPDGSRGAHDAPLILRPGQTAFVTTHEQLNLPNYLAGNISIKGALARQGVLLMTGLVVDPGYGPKEGIDGKQIRDGRLHFYLVNLGREDVVIQPLRTKVATIQFIRIDGHAGELDDTSVDDLWKRQDIKLGSGLGFIENLTTLKETVADIKQRLDRQARATEIVIAAAIFVLATTVLGVSLSTILTLASDDKLAAAVNNAVPDDDNTKLFLAAVVFSVAWSIYSLALLFRGRAPAAPPPHASPDERRQEAVRWLRYRRDRRWSWAALLVVAILIACVEIGRRVDVGWAQWWMIALLPAILLIAMFYLGEKLWEPITPKRVHDQERDWVRDDEHARQGIQEHTPVRERGKRFPRLKRRWGIGRGR